MPARKASARAPAAPDGGLERPTVDDAELEPLLEAFARVYDYDFRGYARASLRRRVRQQLVAEGLRSVSELRGHVLEDAAAAERLVVGLTVHTTEMFRDPDVFRTLREKVVPLLRTYPYVRVWCAGCSTGEEVVSLAILLEEAGLGRRARIYATDVNETIVNAARAGIFPLDKMRAYSGSYVAAGGAGSLSDYYTARHGHALFHPRLLERVVFSRHDFTRHASFNEFQLILCRNVLIYFDAPLQERALLLLYESLASFGHLALGTSETLRSSTLANSLIEVDGAARIYRRTD